MIGILEWGRPTRPEAGQILGMRYLRVQVKQEGPFLRRRCIRALKSLERQGVRRLILPEAFPYPALPEQYGMDSAGTLPLRHALAADWVAWALRRKGGAEERVAVSAEHLTPGVVHTVTELALRCRYLLLETPYGGEELCRTLRKEYGVSLILNPGAEALEKAEVWLAYERPASGKSAQGVLLPLYDEAVPMPPLLLPPALEEQLPETARPQLLSALLEAGLLRPGQIALT